MLKYIRGLVLCLVVLIELAYVPPTYAASANIVMTQIQAGGVGAALEEIVVLYNNSAEDVNISDWCLKNKSNLTFVCFQHEALKTVYLPAYKYATIGSYSLATTLNFYDFSYLYLPINQSSGNIVGGSDTITLVDGYDIKIDSHNWQTSLVGGMVLERQVSSLLPLTYQDTDQVSDWHITSPLFIPDNGIEIRDADPDACPNIEGYQAVVPEGLEIGGSGNCREKLYSLRLWEIMPNASGSDMGKEFIEIYNPNNLDIDLSRYQLLIGQTLEKIYPFPAGSHISAHSYLSFTNAEVGFSLLNTSSRVQLQGEGDVVDESPAYLDPDEDTSWGIVDGMWQYTNHPTPGSDNLSLGDLGGEESPESENETTSSLKPCNENQYRSPETNRCRNLETATTKTQTPCKDGQYRSEETNRCRNIAIASDEPAPCKEGQERNPETNRCRTIKVVSQADYGVLGATTSKEANNWYIWLAIGGIILLALGYSVWEWRFEIGKLFHKLAGFVRIRK